mgnify:CR=1 FL=1
MIASKRIFFLCIVISCHILLFSSNALSGENNEPLHSSKNIVQQLQALEALTGSNEAIEFSLLLLESTNLTAQQRIRILKVQEGSYAELSNYDLASKVARNINVLAAQSNLPQVEANAYKRIGAYHYFKGENEQALVAYQVSLDFYLQANQPVKLANIYNNIALAYAAMGGVAKAIENYHLAETLYHEKGSEADKADIRYNIAGLYLRLKRFDMAIELYLDVIKRFSDANQHLMLAKARGELGTTYKYSGEYKQALALLLQAITYFDKTNDLYNLAAFSHNIAGLYNMMNQPLNAIKHANNAIKIGKDTGHNNAYSGGLYCLAQAQLSLGYVDEAYNNLLLSNNIATKMKHQDQINYNTALFSLIYTAQGRLREGVITYQEYFKQATKTANNALNVQLAEFEAKQLKQQVSQLQQSKELQDLQNEQAEQQRNFSIVAAIFILVVVFFIFSRNLDRRSKLKLSGRVKHRTHELELLTSELVKANAIKSQFLANMSHEIRTPLTSIIGQAEAIVQGDVDDKLLHKEVEIIHGNSLHLLELINNILDLSKVEANKLELELVEQDLQHILHELASMFTKQAKEKGLTFEIIHRLPSPFILKIDSFRLKQILINLCSNALKFTHRGAISLNVSIHQHELRFALTDTGIGMSETQLRGIFESFTQGDSSISRRFGGSGLGLCLSEQLAKLMRGRIDVTSVLNRGSTFTLSLECDQLEQADIVPISIVARNLELPSIVANFSGQVILADDHDDNRRLIARLLSSLGLEVLCASNGREAVELCLDSSPKLILMDIQMPEMDGLEAFKVLRQQGCTQPIVALTANAMSHEIEKYLDLGFDGHLKKPIERKLFIATIAKYCGDNVDENDAQETIAAVDMSDLVIEFKSNLVLEQQDLILHITNNELEKLARLAHRIAGAAQMFGFSLVSVSAIKLEKSISTGNSQQISDAAQCLLNDIDQVLW